MRQLRTFSRCFVIALGGIVIQGCGESLVGPSDPNGLTVVVNGGEIRYVRWANGPTVMEYQFCYYINPSQGVSGTITIQKAETTVVGPSGTSYNTSTDLFRAGQLVHGGLFGCPTIYSDPNVDRPLATTYRLRIDYTTEGSGKSRAVSASGTFVSRVPRLPLMSGLTLTHDIADPQRILRQRAPVTFTATGFGGIPPHQFKWTMNGFVLRDWDPNPILVWDGTTLGPGRPITNGSYTVVVQGRSDGNTDPESAATLDIRVQY